MQNFTVHLKKAVGPAYHVLKTIIMLLPDSMGYITRAPIIRHASEQLLKNPDGGFQLHLHGVPQEVCVIISLLPSEFCRADPTEHGASCCYWWTVTVLAITLNSHQNALCERTHLIHKSKFVAHEQKLLEEFLTEGRSLSFFFLIMLCVAIPQKINVKEMNLGFGFS